MRKDIYILISLFVLISCSGNQKTRGLFYRVESVINDYPDSALALLDSISVHKDSYPRSQRMRYELLRAKAQNKAYVDFTTDSVMKEVVEYYDSHGTANEQIEAHYLLGCTYRDLHESPMALSCYLDAVGRADTLSEDCDYDMLMRVWGQIANEYDIQYMPYKELDALKMYRMYAKRCGNELEYIIGIELNKRPYYMLRDSAKAIECINKAITLYNQNGYKRNAAKALPPLIYFSVDSQNYIKARQLMTYFEKYSGAIDACGNIDKTMSPYYNIKAMYYQYTNNIDSAIVYYSKLIKYGHELEAYEGLLNIYVYQENIDSIRKYIMLMEDGQDRKISHIHTDAMFNTEAMFNYSRNQRIAMEKELEAANSKAKTIIILIISAILLSIAFLLLIAFRQKKRRELRNIKREYRLSREAYMHAKEDFVLMNADFDAYKAMKNEEMNDILCKYEELSRKYEATKIIGDIKSVKSNPIILEIQRRLSNGRSMVNMIITNTEWDEIYGLVRDKMPGFYMHVLMNDKLSDQERKIAFFTLINEHSSNIAIMLNSTVSNVSNTKMRINQKLFNDNNAKSLYSNLINMSM